MVDGQQHGCGFLVPQRPQRALLGDRFGQRADDAIAPLGDPAVATTALRAFDQLVPAFVGAVNPPAKTPRPAALRQRVLLGASE